jgi:hypothetical protein
MGDAEMNDAESGVPTFYFSFSLLLLKEAVCLAFWEKFTAPCKAQTLKA